MKRLWIGAAIGLLLGAFDFTLANALAIEVRYAGRDILPWAGAYMGLSFAGFGAIAGYALETRRRERLAAAGARAREEELAGTRIRLAQNEKLASLGQLASAIAHEVRNPLAIIRSWVQNLLEEVPPEAASAVERTARYILDEIDRLTRVTGALVSFARPLPVRRAPVAAAAVFERTFVLAGKLLAGKDVRLLATGPPSTEGPGGDGGGERLDVDLDLDCQALLGLIGNAAEVSPPGGAIVLEARPAAGGGAAFEFAVSDEGPGVPPDIREKIFEPFFTTKSSGAGLGLAIARQIASAHGGKIEVADGPRGKGARFALTLAVAVADAGASKLAEVTA